MVSSSDIEKSISYLERQIAWLEEQRKTLDLSLEDAADADRRLAELKLRYADTVSAYRKSQASGSPAAASQAPAPRKRGTNWLTPLIGILVLLAAIAASAFSRKAPEPAAVNECLRSRSKLETWKKILSAASDLSADMQQQLDSHGHPEYTVSLSIVNPDDFSQIFATVERGSVLYDIVDSTAPGEEIPDPLRSTSSDSAISYIVNLSTNVFHFPDCPALDRLSSSNRSVFTGDRADLLSQGYIPCGQCKP